MTAHRKAQFFIITTVLLSGALLFINSSLHSGADIDYTDVLQRHDTAVMSNAADQLREQWWNQNWTYRTTVTATDQSGTYQEQVWTPIVLPVRQSQLQDTCDGIRVIIDGEEVPWQNTTTCDIDTYDSTTQAIARYKMDELSGQWANDSTGNDHQGTLYGSPTWVSGRYDGGLYFDGSSDYIGIDTSSMLNPANTVSVSAWIRPAAISGSESMRIFQRESSTYGLYIESDGRLTFYTDTGNDGGSWQAARYQLPAADTWYHVTGTYDGGDVRLYVDGIEQDSTSQSGTIDSGGSNAAAIGSNSDGSAQFFNGVIDDVRIYDVALAPDEVRGIAQNGVGLNVSTTTAPLEEKTVAVYHGNPFVDAPNYTSEIGNVSTTNTPPAVTNIGPTRHQNTVTAVGNKSIASFDEELGSSLQYHVRQQRCNILRLQATDTTLEQEIC